MSMTLEKEPHFWIGVIWTLLLAGFGHLIHEVMLLIPFEGILHLMMSLAKGLSYLGSGLVGITTFGKWFKTTKLYNWITNGHK